MASVDRSVVRSVLLKSGGGGYWYFGSAPASLVNVALASSGQSDNLVIRKVIRTGTLDLLVNDVGQSISKIGSINLPLIAVWLFSVIILLLVAVRILKLLMGEVWAKSSWRLPWRRATSRTEPGTQ